MHFATALTAAVATVPALVQAHGSGASLPNIVGLNVKDLKARDLLEKFQERAEAARIASAHEHSEKLDKRQGQERCGEGFGSCPTGVCCSGSGYCGTSPDHCYAPGCNYKFGPGCPDNATPGGTNTSSVARPKNGNVPYGGGGIYPCTTPGTVAITYDDGPMKDLTSHILDVFKSYGGRATFFITGNNVNKGQIDLESTGYPAVIKRMAAEGHQVASHTWTHLDLSAISAEDRRNQMWKNEMALRNILGYFPTYMRPPYSSCSPQSGCERDMADLGYHVTYFDLDTDDYNQLTADKIQNSKNWFKGNMTANGANPQNKQWLSIAHDIHEQTARNLTEFMLSTLTQLGYKAVTVGECLGDPKENWYRSSTGGGTQPPTTTSTAAPPSGTKRVSTDATCGGANGYTCQGSTFGNCCSVAGWCGSTTAYCGNGCQPDFGTCGTGSNPPGGVSEDGTCGGTGGQTCQNSEFGNCCSQYGWCGTTTDHCGTGCQTTFGTCG